MMFPLRIFELAMIEGCPQFLGARNASAWASSKSRTQSVEPASSVSFDMVKVLLQLTMLDEFQDGTWWYYITLAYCSNSTKVRKALPGSRVVYIDDVSSIFSGFQCFLSIWGWLYVYIYIHNIYIYTHIFIIYIYITVHLTKPSHVMLDQQLEMANPGAIPDHSLTRRKQTTAFLCAQ